MQISFEEEVVCEYVSGIENKEINKMCVYGVETIDNLKEMLVIYEKFKHNSCKSKENTQRSRKIKKDETK